MSTTAQGFEQLGAVAELDDPFARILMLVPHEPTEDPRIQWVTTLCRSIARTDVLGTVWSNQRQAREYDGQVYVERVNIAEATTSFARGVAARLGRLWGSGPTLRYLQREGRPPQSSGRRTNFPRLLLEVVDHYVGSLLRFLAAISAYNLIREALHLRGRAVSIAPRVIVCHDIYALVPAVSLKRQFRCRVLYDSHEFWPEADLLATGWERWLTRVLERHFIRQADVVVTVTPQLARHLEQIYDIRGVLPVPNAVPVSDAKGTLPSCTQPAHRPVRFLLQGRVAPRRGIDELVSEWSEIDPSRAVLYLRCPDSPHLTDLVKRHNDAIARGSLVLLPPVPEESLVQAAAFADVGVIPYPRESLNHVFACPNKLSQYMQAGLAILTSDLDFVAETVSQQRCGVTYRPSVEGSLKSAVETIAADIPALESMKMNAHSFATSTFNWEAQAQAYSAAIRRLARMDGLDS